ncbi:MAG: hypothetical protein JWQ04_549 [Pedosphaera sp.]|nr:hypothetical protein [Pedosphaera sp.]
MLLEQRQKLLLKRSGLMMPFLVLDVSDDQIQLRHAHAEAPILFLPRKEAVFGEGFMHPLGGAALDQLHGLGRRQRRWQ